MSAAGEAAVKRQKVHKLNPRRRKHIKQGAAAALPPDELARRQEQKRRREVAMKVRAEGRTYNPRVFKRKAHGDEGGGDAKKVRVKVKSSQRGKQPYHVVILPIVWKQRKEEAAKIEAACEAAAALLAAAAITRHIDNTDVYTPGQKMKYWEQRGVKVRLEIGPKEALAGTAILALAGNPGEVARKQSVKVKPQLLADKVKEALQQQGVELPAAAVGAAAVGSGEVEAEGGTAGKQQQQQEEEQEEVGGGKVKGKKAFKRRAEQDEQQQQVEGAGDGAAAAGDDTEGQTPQKKKKKKKQHKHLLEDGKEAMHVAEQVTAYEQQQKGGEGQQLLQGKHMKQKQPQQPADAEQKGAAGADLHTQQQKQKQQSSAPLKQRMVGGDDLEDDFAEVLAAAAAGGGGKVSAKKKTKQSQESVSAADGAERAAGKSPASGGKHGSKGHKVVKF